ncbi:MAG: HNH endonuclease [Microbacterium ginsengisoli]|nr:HNH endonuclease [Microbacterium ginsengisoli]
MPNWASSTRRDTLPSDWPQRVAYVLRRDHHVCQHVREDTGRKCGRRARDVDHRIRPADGGTDDPSNLQALCGWHHDQKSGREGGVASGRARRAKRDAAAPIHPGLVRSPDELEPPPF